jgi:hypothetical protein
MNSPPDAILGGLIYSVYISLLYLVEGDAWQRVNYPTVNDEMSDM